MAAKKPSQLLSSFIHRSTVLSKGVVNLGAFDAVDFAAFSLANIQVCIGKVLQMGCRCGMKRSILFFPLSVRLRCCSQIFEILSILSELFSHIPDAKHGNLPYFTCIITPLCRCMFYFIALCGPFPAVNRFFQPSAY